MEIIKLTQAQYDAFENGTVTTSFEMLDVDKDGNITEADLNATQNEKIKQDIQTLLNQADADSELKEFSLEEIDALLQENAQQTTAGNTTAADEGRTQIIIEGVENVDITNIKDETAEELQAKLTKIENNIKDYNTPEKKQEIAKSLARHHYILSEMVGIGTNKISTKILAVEENAKKTNGVFESPSAEKIPVAIL